jgi:hypothetical protein
LTFFDQIYFAKNALILQIKSTWESIFSDSTDAQSKRVKVINFLPLHCCIVETCFEIQLSPAN